MASAGVNQGIGAAVCGRKGLLQPLPAETRALGQPPLGALEPNIKVVPWRACALSDGCQIAQLHRERVTKLLPGRDFLFIFVIVKVTPA